MNPVLDAIHKRRSIRDFTADSIEHQTLIQIIKAGTWAPSGLNNQPWRFAIVTDKELKAKIAELTRYEKVIQGSKALIPVFVDKDAMYNELKDYQAIGACIQNMLLAAYSLDLGAVWLGEILKNSDRVRGLLGLSQNFALMAVLALGHPAHRKQTSTRKSLEEVIIFEK
jgi:nitroreductase|nr:nitroreductase family protein [Deltaproteobacteria bacterium]